MSKIKDTIMQILDEIYPHHTENTYKSRKVALMNLLKFAENHGFTEPCAELYNAFTSNDKGSRNIRFHLTHAVRLVDKAANTKAKDRNGRLYNEPILPTYSKAKEFFDASGFPIPDHTDIGMLIIYSENLLNKLNLTKSTRGQYVHAWIDLRRLFYDHGYEYYDKNIVLEFIDRCRSLYNENKMKEWKWKINRRAGFVIIEVAETGEINWRQVPRCSFSCGDTAIDSIKGEYISFLKSRNFEANTIYLYEYVFRYSMKHGNISNLTQLENITVEMISNIITKFSELCTRRSMGTISNILKSIFEYLYTKGYTKKNISGIIMPSAGHRNHIVPYISADLDEVIYNALAKEESLRNKAMILLAFRLGLRDSDICNLEFTSIDWVNDKLNICQKKNDVPLSLPLLPDVGNAIMEYIAKERPMNDDKYPYVFRRKQAPYNKLISMYVICARFIEKNRITVVNGNLQGVHLFRYTLVNRMLKAKVPHNVITDVLGHTAKESDKSYLSMESDMLRMCSLDLSIIGVPPI